MRLRNYQKKLKRKIEMNKKKVLVIPGGFVPYNDTVTLLSYKHLRNIDADFDVVALQGKEDKGLKSCIENDKNFSKFKIEYVCDYNDAIATLERKNVLSGVMNIMKYCRFAKKKAKLNNYDFVYTSSIPAFTHLAGYWIKKMKGDKIKWVASFSDPLYKSPYKYDEDTLREYSLITKIGFYIYIWIYMNAWYEKIAMKYADKIVYICEEQRNFMIEHYENKDELLKKSMIIPLNYIKDWEIYSNLMNCKKNSSEKPRKIYHFGRIYGLRKIDNLLLALKELKVEDPNLCYKIKFKQYGEFNQRYKNMINELNISDVFENFDKVSYDEVMNLMVECDVLALFDTIMKDDDEQPYLPSKTLEYILLKKEVFILTTKKSPAYRIFKSLGFIPTLNNIQAIKENLKELINNKQRVYNYDIEQYENSKATVKLKEYIESNSK